MPLDDAFGYVRSQDLLARRRRSQEMREMTILPRSLDECWRRYAWTGAEFAG
jgi:hypothetical protein